MTPGLSNATWDHILNYAEHQIRHHGTNKTGGHGQLGDFSWPLLSSSKTCVTIYGLIYSLYHIQGVVYLVHILLLSAHVVTWNMYPLIVNDTSVPGTILLFYYIVLY